MCLNVCGLRSRLTCPELVDFINDFDIVGLQETKTDMLDELEINNYELVLKPRTGSFRKSGGIGVAIKNHLVKHVTVVEENNDFVLWIQISKEMLNIQQDLFVGIVYMPPEGSRFVSDDSFDIVEQSILNHIAKSEFVMVMGDFNARTGTVCDYCSFDKNLVKELDMDIIELRSEIEPETQLDDLNIPRNRYSQDTKRINNFGRKLIEICKNCNLFICNGRIGVDKYVGKPTCKDKSVIDYAIASLRCLSKIADLEVLEYCPLYSDVHSALSISINVEQHRKDKTRLQSTKQIKESTNDVKYPRKFMKDKSNEFCKNINLSKIEDVSQQIKYQQGQFDVKGQLDTNIVNAIVTDIGHVLTSAARTTFGDRSSTNTPKHLNKKSKPWFGQQCKTARKRFKHARNRFKNSKTIANKTHYIAESKLYKKSLKINKKKQIKYVQTMLRNKAKYAPREYWKLLNNKNMSDNAETPDIDSFFTFYEELNAKCTDDELIEPEYTIPDMMDTSMLNDAISITELHIAIKKLKNNKACGLDRIENEYFKASADIMGPIYLDILNLVFKSGTIPESWLTGTIKPLYKKKGDKFDPNSYRPITILSCFGKLFTNILNARLARFLESNNIINPSQAGFRKGFSSSDNTFVLHMLTKCLQASKKKIYCAFIDFTKAFDNVWRVGLWHKLLITGINGHFLDIVKNMYNGIKSCVCLKGNYSDTFPCLSGVRQGENLSPLLLSIFINDLESSLLRTGCDAITLNCADENDVCFLYTCYVIVVRG